MLSRWERGLLGLVRVVVALTAAGMALAVPVTLFGTVYGAVTGIQGARAVGVTFPVRLATEPPPGTVVPGGLAPGTLGSGVPTTDLSLLAGALPVGTAVACAVAWLVPALLTVAALVRGYRLSVALTDRARFEHAVPAQMRTLAAWVAGAGAAWAVLGTAGSAVGVAALGDPRLFATVHVGPLLVGAGLAAVLVVVTVVLRSATALQDDQDLTV